MFGLLKSCLGALCHLSTLNGETIVAPGQHQCAGDGKANAQHGQRRLCLKAILGRRRSRSPQKDEQETEDRVQDELMPANAERTKRLPGMGQRLASTTAGKNGWCKAMDIQTSAAG